MRDIFDDFENEEMLFELRLCGILLALVVNKSENLPKVPSDEDMDDIKNFYVVYTSQLDKKTFKAYKKSLNERSKDLPDEMVYPFGDEAKKETLSIADLKVYDAILLYNAKESGKDFMIGKDGKLKIGAAAKGIEIDVSPEEDIKSIDDEYYKD